MGQSANGWNAPTPKLNKSSIKGRDKLFFKFVAFVATQNKCHSISSHQRSIKEIYNFLVFSDVTNKNNRPSKKEQSKTVNEAKAFSAEIFVFI